MRIMSLLFVCLTACGSSNGSAGQRDMCIALSTAVTRYASRCNVSYDAESALEKCIDDKGAWSFEYDLMSDKLDRCVAIIDALPCGNSINANTCR